MAINDVMAQTINYEVYVDGDRYLGTASVDNPELNYLTTEISGAGIGGKIEIPTLGHTENMEITLHWRSIFENPLKLQKQAAFMMSCRGAMQKYDAATGELKVLPVRIDARCLPTSLNLGKLEPAETTDTESKFVIDYISIKLDGSKIYEHDKFNYVHEVDGQDYMAAVRAALGL